MDLKKPEEQVAKRRWEETGTTDQGKGDPRMKMEQDFKSCLLEIENSLGLVFIFNNFTVVKKW